VAGPSGLEPVVEFLDPIFEPRRLPQIRDRSDHDAAFVRPRPGGIVRLGMDIKIGSFVNFPG
jgi:hypothetical protein